MLLLIISLISAVFAVVLEYEDALHKSVKPRYIINGLFIIIGIAVFFIYREYWYSYTFLIPAGFIYTLISFIYLEVISVRLRLNHFSVHLIMIIIMAAISRTGLIEAMYMLMVFIFSYIFFSVIIKKFLKSIKQKTENIKSLFELLRIVNGIYLFIVSLIFTTNRIHFLERIAQFLFD